MRRPISAASHPGLFCLLKNWGGGGGGGGGGIKITPDDPKNDSGLTQMRMMDNSILHIWVKFKL